MMKDYELKTLPNGIRVVHKQVANTKIAHCGLVLDVGSRDETHINQGIAHFWEHMAFKGTTKRKAFHILNRIDAVGGELNAFTTKEKIAFYVSVLDHYFEKATELLADITFNSVFPEREIEKERNVILEEMSMYYDTPEDAIQDEFDTVIFKGHPLGMNILGRPETVRSFKREDFKYFLHQQMDTGRIVFSSVSAKPFKEVLEMAEKYLSDIPTMTADKERQPFLNYGPVNVNQSRAITQAHCAIGRNAYPTAHIKRLPFFMLNNILGGPAMNSRLNLALREKYGFVYNIESHFQSYIDTGLFAIFFATEPRQLKKGIRLIFKELKLLREKPLGAVQLKTAKEQLMGQLAMSEENNASLMLMMAKSLLDLDKIESLETIFKQIQNVTAREILDMANEMFVEDELSILTYTPD